MVGKRLAFDDPQSVLFFEFVRLLKDQPKWFLLENVKMKKEYLNVIMNMGVEPILLNSAVSHDKTGGDTIGLIYPGSTNLKIGVLY